MARMLRPKATVLPDSALVPEENLLRTPPRRFTHEVEAEQPYYYSNAARAAAPDGTFPAGTQVAVLSPEEGEMCRVADGRGLSVFTAFGGLRALR